MAAVTGPGVGGSAPGKRRRRTLLWVSAAWGVVVVVLSGWAVGHSAATVPEQRTAAQALPTFREAVGAVFKAASGPGRAVVLQALQVDQGCRVTPVRHGVSLTRDVTVYVRAGEQRGDVEALAAGLPADYRVRVTPSDGGTHFTVHADAGNFIAVDLDADLGDVALTVHVATGCRPVGAGGVDRSDPRLGPPPAAMATLLDLLGSPDVVLITGTEIDGSPGPVGAASGPTADVSPAGRTGSPSRQPVGQPVGQHSLPPSEPPATPQPDAPTGSAVPDVLTTQGAECPGGGTAGTYTISGVAAPKDWAKRLATVASGSAAVRSDPSRWAYRDGDDSIVVVDDETGLRVSASTAC
jgi:hypothetical protein